MITRFVSIVILVLAAAVSAAVPGPLLPLLDQKQILLDSIQRVLTSREFAPHAPGVRVLGVGSWLGGVTTPSSDVDATLYCRDGALQRRMVDAINADVERQVRARGGGLGHKIKLIVDRDAAFVELFPGETGQKFVYDYCAGKNPSACLRFDGERLVSAPTEEFWTCRGGKYAVPHFIDRPQDFIAKSLELLEKSRGEARPLCYALFDAAKYANNVDDWLQRRMLEQLGTAEGIALSPELKARVEQLAAIKKAVASEGLDADRMLVRYQQEVARLFGGDDEARRFLDDIGDYFRRSQTAAALIDAQVKGELRGIGALVDKVAKHGVALALLPLEALAIRTRYVEEGPQAAAEETLFTLLAHGVPATAVARLVGEVLRLVVGEGIRFAGNYFVFDPVHEALLQRIFDERDEQGHENAIGIYGWERSPLGGVKRETLYARHPRNMLEEAMPWLEAAANAYVERLTAWKGFSGVGVFASAGAADLRRMVLAQLVNDWRSSRDVSRNVELWAVRLASGYYTPAGQPLRVWLDGASPAGLARSEATARPGRPATFQLTLRHELDQLELIYQKDDLYAIWAREGLARARQRVLQATREYVAQNGAFRAWADETVEVEVTVQNPEGWTLSGDLPGLSDLAPGQSRSRGSLPVGGHAPHRVRIDPYAVRCAPGPDARGDLSVELTFSHRRSSPGPSRTPVERRTRYRCLMTARLERPPPPSAPPRRIPASPSGRRSPEPPLASARPVEAAPGRPTAPRPARVFDAACALARWVAAFEARANRSGHDGGCAWSYQLRWTRAPFLRDGEVLGAFEKLVSKRYDDGRVVAPYAEVISGEAASPVRLATLGELASLFPECARDGAPEGGAPGGDAERALAAWKREFEKVRHDRTDTYQSTSRVEWTCPPFIKDGAVHGAFKRMTSKTYHDGRVVDAYPEVEMFDAAHPGVLTTVSELEKIAR